jgi:hypothetical protein
MSTWVKVKHKGGDAYFDLAKATHVEVRQGPTKDQQVVDIYWGSEAKEVISDYEQNKEIIARMEAMLS